MVKNHLQASPAFAALPGKDLQIIQQTNLFIAFIQFTDLANILVLSSLLPQ